MGKQGSKDKGCSPCYVWGRLCSALFLPADGAGLAREGWAAAVGCLPASISPCPSPWSFPWARRAPLSCRRLLVPPPGQRIHPQGLSRWREAPASLVMPAQSRIHQWGLMSIKASLSTSPLVSACPCLPVHKHFFAPKLWPTLSTQRPSTHPCPPSLLPALVQCHCLQLSEGLISTPGFPLSLSQDQHERWICSCQVSKLNLVS